MKKLMLVLMIVSIVSIMVSTAHAYEVRTVIRGDGTPYTWTSY